MADRHFAPGFGLIFWMAVSMIINASALACGFAFGLLYGLGVYLGSLLILAILLIGFFIRDLLLEGSSAERCPKRAAPPCTSAGFNSEREP